MCRYRTEHVLANQNDMQGLVKNPDSAQLIKFAGPGAPHHYPPDLRLEPTHLKIDLHIDIESETASGAVTTTVVANDDGAVRLELDAIDFCDVKVSDDKHGLSHTYDGTKIRIVWDKDFKRGETREVTVRYHVTSPISGLFFSKPSREYPNKATYAATDHETERARYWLPCIDLPNVRTTLDFHLRAKAAYEILANGKHAGEVVHKDGTKTVRWQLEQRCPSYLVCFAIGDFVAFDDGEFEGIPVKYFASKSHFKSEDLRRAFGRTKDMLAWMTRKLDMPFPFPKYYQFALPNFGGAMENISLVSWDDWFVLDGECAKERTWITDQVNLHEMAHSYFGDTVVIREFAHAWLKESWATYMEQCWLEDSKGAAAQDEWMGDFYNNSIAYFAESEDSYARPIVNRQYKSSWQMYDRHLYPGGACRLHTLRKHVGDEAFWRAVRDYLKTFAGKVAETDDFRKIVEKHSGRSLVKFFDQWFMRPGFPDLKVSFTWDKQTKTGKFTVEQKQVDEAAGRLPFDLVTDIGWTIGGREYLQEVHVERKVQDFEFVMEQDPEQVRFNPTARVLCRIEFNPGDERLKKQLSSSKDVIGRILAAQELAKSARKSALQAIADAYKKEKFWVTKREMVKAISKAGTAFAVKLVAEIVRTETDPMVMESVFAHAAKLRDQEIADALQSRFKDKMPPMCRAALIGAMGAQRDRIAFEKLVQAASEVDVHGVVRMAALRAMADSRHGQALEKILEASRYGAPTERTRGAAAGALGQLAPVSDRASKEKIVDRLQEMLRDPQDFVRWAALIGLRTAESTESMGVMSAFRATVPLQQQVVVDRAVEAVARATDPRFAGVEVRLDDYADKWRKVETRLQCLEDKSSPKSAGKPAAKSRSQLKKKSRSKR